MLHLIAMFTALSVVFTGLYVLAKGDWHRFGLKFAGVAISTSAACWLVGAQLTFGSGIITCPSDMPAQACLTFELYHIIRNVAFVIFHIAIGRDAISYKKRDRRGAQCQKNLSKQPLRS